VFLQHLSDEGVIGTVVSVIDGLVGCGHRPGPNIRTNALFVLQLRLPDVVAMQSGQANLEGTGEIPLRRLVKEALRMRPSRLIVGEVRQAECLDPSRCRLSILGLIAYFLQLDLWTRTGVGVTPREGGRRTLFTNLCDFESRHLQD
jgi:hypothetical protein